MEGRDFFVEDLLDFSNGGGDMMADAFFAGNSTDSSALTPVSDSCNSSGSAGPPSFPNSHFSDDLCVPCDELEELKWLSNFVEESFSTEELHTFQFNAPQPSPAQYPIRELNLDPAHQQNSTVPGKARSKRSRVPPCDWSNRVLMVSNQNMSPAMPSSSGQKTGPRPSPKNYKKKRELGADTDSLRAGEMRRCVHCAAEKTPQWRTGPMGPKTLCNACGVRYKSGRLVPEYRPAASPTFVSTKHSNSHRKVVELRRQKEVQIHHQQSHFVGHRHQHPHHHHHHHHHHQKMMMGVSNCGDDHLIHHHLAFDHRQQMMS